MGIDHEARKRRILDKALALVAEQGYGGLTFRELADRCGIARTTLYRYFHGKGQLLDSAVRQVTEQIAEQLAVVTRQSGRPAPERIEQAMHVVLDEVFNQRRVLTALLSHLLEQKRVGQDINATVRRYTADFMLLMNNLVNEAIRRKEIGQTSAHTASALLYGLLESAIMEATVSGMASRDRFQRMVQLAIHGLQTA